MAKDTNSETTEDLTILANPSKDFFIDMLTRDIGLVDCILDLVDNSVHSMIRESGLDVMQRLIGKGGSTKVKASVDISFSKMKFTIADTCGGIHVKDARKEVFLFGNPTRDRKNTGLGVYGIGMKRAMFKLGRYIEVKSNTTDEEFLVKLDVDQWRNEKKKWDLEFTYARQKKSRVGGTTIDITRLYEENQTRLGLSAFRKELMDRLATAYALFIQAGLKITVNNTPVVADLPEIGGSRDVTPVRQMFKKDGVDILIMAGMSPKEDRTPRGWYVFCNGRMILEADKSKRTGWDDGLPSFHSKFNHFLGYVYFRSKDERKLPWTTTKEDVQRELPVYQEALGQMRVLARPILDFFSGMYPGDQKAEGTQQKALFDATKPIKVDTLAKKANTTFATRTRNKPANATVSIQYSKPLKEVERVKKAIGKPRMPAYRVGEYTFDYFMEQECE